MRTWSCLSLENNILNICEVVVTAKYLLIVFSLIWDLILCWKGPSGVVGLVR